MNGFTGLPRKASVHRRVGGGDDLARVGGFMASTFTRPPASIEAAGSSEIECVSIRDVLARAADGRLRTTAYRRDFVWNAADTAALMDSLYRGFPVGIIVVWRTSMQQSTPGEEHDYVLDGRQRLEALCRVFGPRKHLGGDTQRFDFYLDRTADDATPADRIVALERDRVVPGRHALLRSVFASRANGDGVRAAFERVTIPLQIVRTRSSEDVALLVERLNRAGVVEEDFEIIRAWAWHDAQARGAT
jgi:Protein of unknown function DUF262